MNHDNECPFCGGESIRIMRRGYTDPEFIGCPKCDIFTRPRKWNSRVFPAWLRKKIEQLKIENPYVDIHDADLSYGYDDALDKVLSLTPGDGK